MAPGYVLVAWIQSQGLDCSERQRVLTNKNLDDIYNVIRKSGSKNANEISDRLKAISFSHSLEKPEASCLLIPS